MKDLVSVIIPIFNVERYICECIQSILNQSYKNFELILVDDGSSDESYEVTFKMINNIKCKNKIILLRVENGGQAKARNLGLKYAKGDFISFIDSDDFIHHEMFATLIPYMKSENLDIIQCTYMNWFKNDDLRNNIYNFDVQENKVFMGRDYYEKFPSLSPCDKIYRKSFLESINFECIEGFYAEDVYDISRIILNAKKIMYVNKCLYYYRRTNNNSTRNNQSDYKIIKLGSDKISISNMLYNYLKKNNINSDAGNIIILRNIIGVFMNKNIISKIYRKKVIQVFKDNKGWHIFTKSFKFIYFREFFKIFYKKKILKCD